MTATEPAWKKFLKLKSDVPVAIANIADNAISTNILKRKRDPLPEPKRSILKKPTSTEDIVEKKAKANKQKKKAKTKSTKYGIDKDDDELIDIQSRDRKKTKQTQEPLNKVHYTIWTNTPPTQKPGNSQNRDKTIYSNIRITMTWFRTFSFRNWSSTCKDFKVVPKIGVWKWRNEWLIVINRNNNNNKAN